MNQFIHLRNHTQFSLSEGAIKIGELVELATDNKMPAVAITDTANLFGIMEFSKAAAGKGVQPIIGCELTVEGSKLVVYAANDKGFENILKLVSKSFLDSSSPHDASLDLVELEKFAEGILVLTAGTQGELGKALLAGEVHKAEAFLERINSIFPNRIYIELNRHGIEDEQKLEPKLIDIAYKYNLPLIATNNCFFADREMYEAHDALLCIAQGKVIADQNRRRLNPEFYFKSTKEMCQLFADIPEAIANTIQFAKRCSVKAEGRKPLLPDFPTVEGRTQEDELRAQAREGLRERLNRLTPPLRGSQIATQSGGGKAYNTNLTERAQELRREQTPWETKLWYKINDEQLGYKFRRQQPIGNYIADFINFEKGLILELDGSQHAEQKEYDADRDKYLADCGYKVLRFWNNEVDENLDGVLEKISKELKDAPHQNAAHFDSPSRGEYEERLEFELDVINKMQFPGYFLIVSDFIKWAKSQGIPVGPGRGSGAGSVVAWSLQITDLDPIKFGLLFERFLNPDRVSMPDFDIDFCQERRDEVIEYVKNKYGRDKVSQIITFGKLQARAVIRDVGRVLQMPYSEVDKISKMIPFNPIDPVTLEKAIELDSELKRLQREDEQTGKLLDIGLKLEGLNRHASTHAAGVLIGDRPLEQLIPLYKDPRSDLQVSQYSMKDAETAGLVKFDFLGLRTLTLIDKALKFIEKRGEKIDITAIPLDRKEVFDMLSKGETVGVFQLDSTLVRDAIRKMRPDKFEDIVALTSLCRPGPMENIPTYVARKHGKEKLEFPHEKLSGLLTETYGIMVYQEQVMQAAQILAGYTLGGADLLRRAMGKKIKAEMDEQRKMFCQGAEANGIKKLHATEIFDLIAKFAGYGFNKSHAVAYALIAYQTAYLRCFYPVEFFAACMNLDIGDTDKLSFYKNEAQQQNIEILTPDVNRSMALFEPVDGKISYGLGAIKGVGQEAAKLMVEEREQNGKFKDLFDWAKRLDVKVVNKKHIESLAKAGAFDSFSKNRHQIFESAEIISRYNNAHAREKDSSQISLFGEAEQSFAPPPNLLQVPNWEANEVLEMEYEAFGFYLSKHPLMEYKSALEKLGVIPSNQIETRVKGQAKIMVAGVVATTKLRSGKKGRFGFSKLSDAEGVFEIVMYDDDLITKSAEMLDSNEPLLVTADAKKDEGGVRIIAERIEYLKKVVERRAAQLVKIEEMKFDLKNINYLDALKKILLKNTYKEGDLVKATVKLNLALKDKLVTIELPNSYAVNDNVKAELLEALG